MFGINLQLRSFSIKRCYSFRPIASYRDARGEETHAHTHAHLFLVKWFVTLSEIACCIPGFQRGKDRITIIDKSIGVSSPGNITSMKKSSIMILDFNFTSTISKGSDEPVHLQSLARAFAVHIHKIWQQMKTQTKDWQNNIIEMVTIKIVDEPLR